MIPCSSESWFKLSYSFYCAVYQDAYGFNGGMVINFAVGLDIYYRQVNSFLEIHDATNYVPKLQAQGTLNFSIIPFT